MEKVYLVTIEIIYDVCNRDYRAFVFKDKDNAIKKYNDLVQNEKEEFNDWVCEESDSYCSLYDDGDYNNNHADIYIDELNFED